MHKRFSHYGVLEAAASRVQCYRIGQIEFSGMVSLEEMETIRWIDSEKALQITYDRLDYSAAAHLTAGFSLARIPDALAQAVDRGRTHPSIYSEPLRFRVALWPGFGWVLMHADLRDDKLTAFDDVGAKPVELIEDGQQQRKITLYKLVHVRNAHDLHGATVGQEEDGVSPPAVSSCELTVSRRGNHVDCVRIRFRMARAHLDARHPRIANFSEWVALNVWRVKLAFVSGGNTVDMVFDLEREKDFSASADEQTYEYEWRPSASDQRNGLLASVLSHDGSIL